jgi:multisubunit Na+/H+ antiporter MnhB subunit
LVFGAFKKLKSNRYVTMNYFVTRSLAIILAILGISILFILFNLTYQEFISTFTDYIGIAKEESLKKFVSENLLSYLD